MRAEDDVMIIKEEVGVAQVRIGTARGMPRANVEDIVGSRNYRRAQWRK